MQEYLAVLKKYVAFNGRAGRREYWMFVLISFLIGVALSILDTILGTKTNGQGMLSSLYSLAVFLPGLSVAFRRLHDTNRSGWWVLISFIPVIGWIWIIVILASSGDEGDNQYGAKPVQITA